MDNQKDYELSAIFLRLLKSLNKSRVEFSLYDDNDTTEQYLAEFEFEDSVEGRGVAAITQAMEQLGFELYRVSAYTDNTDIVVLQYSIELLPDGAKRIFDGL